MDIASVWFTGLWRQALGVETFVVLALTIWFLAYHAHSLAIATVLGLAYFVLFVGWLKYLRLELATGVPGLFALL